MHEVGIAQDLIDTVLAYAHEAAAQQVERVILRIGPHSGVDSDSIRFAFQVLAEGTIAAGAAVELEAGSESSPHSDYEHVVEQPHDPADRSIAVVAIEVT
jgi:Zn finger protein HypA/HybF involved in hydrogenase expression